MSEKPQAPRGTYDVLPEQDAARVAVEKVARSVLGGAGYRRIEVDPAEEHAANALRIGEALLYPDCFPRTLERLRAAGIAVATVDVSELQKAEGAVTCCSVVFKTRAVA